MPKPWKPDAPAEPLATPSGLDALPKIKDPILERLAREYLEAERESERHQLNASRAEDSFREASSRLARYVEFEHAERHDDGSLIGYPAFTFGGEVFWLEDGKERKHIHHQELWSLGS
jgi:hypothetical protein